MKQQIQCFDFDVLEELGSNDGKVSMSDVGGEIGICCGEFGVGENEEEGLFIVGIRIGIFGVMDDCDTEGSNVVGGGRGISKISTTSGYPFELFCPPPKNNLSVDDVDAR
jgi:hypothetical protein